MSPDLHLNLIVRYLNFRFCDISFLLQYATVGRVCVRWFAQRRVLVLLTTCATISVRSRVIATNISATPLVIQAPASRACSPLPVLQPVRAVRHPWRNCTRGMVSHQG